MIAIQTYDLTKKYKDKVAVDSINLEIEQGELFSLLGVNGAGKSTTIKMLSCLSKPTSGDAVILGNSILSDARKIKQNINVSPQETAIAPNLTVKENLELIAKIYGADKKEAEEKVKNTIDSFDLKVIENDKTKTLSGGWKRRLSIAMALISDPLILFLDEPTLGLDVLARRELWKVIRDLKGKITIILTTHYMEEAEALSDRVGIIADGKLKAVGTVESLKEETKSTSFEDAFIQLAQAYERSESE